MTVKQAFIQFPTLVTERLRLRQVQPEDAEALFAIKSDLEVTRRYGQEPHRSIEDTRAWIGRVQASYAEHDALFWCLTPTSEDKVIGSCTLWNIEPSFHCAELGYELNPAYFGKGFMAEAASAIIAYGFAELKLSRIEACPLTLNTPSSKLLLRLGFTFEGKLRQRVFFRGELEDQSFFGLLKDEWAQTR